MPIAPWHGALSQKLRAIAQIITGARCGAGALALALSACAAPAPLAVPEPPLSYPPAARERVLRIALAEWREWGARVVEADQPAGPAVPDPAESRPEGFPRILAYWRALDDDEGAVARNRGLYRAALAGRAEGAALWREPFWSAAFVSYVMRAAGVDRAEFPPAAAHATYVDAMIAQARHFPDTAPFVPHDPAARAPQPGDLVCADRSARPLPDWRARLAETGRFRPMHCDLVVATGPGWIGAIGGNVRDAVTLTRFPADAAGYLLPRPAGAGLNWLAVFESRLGCLPPWPACAPAAPSPGSPDA
ncbi:MAG: DUF2272 domain-containing protein [Acetobacteraceae bacterium]|nr:DUF2272 domain-containing protein [Acetobacteraceae bacterium]